VPQHSAFGNIPNFPMNITTPTLLAVAFGTLSTFCYAEPTDLQSVQKAKLDLLESIVSTTQQQAKLGTAHPLDVISANFEATTYRASIAPSCELKTKALQDSVKLADQALSIFASRASAGVPDHQGETLWKLKRLTALELLHSIKP